MQPIVSRFKQSLAAACMLLGLLLPLFLLSCTTESEDDTVTIKVQSAWLEYEKFEVVWTDPQGREKAVLFQGPLKDASSLTQLPGQGYKGEAAIFILRGYKNGVVVFEQKRVYDPGANPALTITTLREPVATGRSLSVEPRRLSLEVGEADSLRAELVIPGENRSVAWTVRNPSLVDITVDEAASTTATVKGLAPGSTWMLVRAKADTSLIDSVPVDVFAKGDAPPAILAFAPDTVISIRDSVAFTASFQARNGNLGSWSLDADGDGKPEFQNDVSAIAQGVTQTITRSHVFKDTGNFVADLSVMDAAGHASRAQVRIGVRLDPPRANAGGDTVLALGNPLVFMGTATQNFGTLVAYRWDFNADGRWDFESKTTGQTTYTYAAEGTFEAVFEVEDDDGNVARAKRRVDIGNKAPVFSGTLDDTVITIKDTLVFKGRVTDADGTVAKLEWDFTGSGAFSQATTPGLAQVDFSVAHVFNTPSVVKVVARATDQGGKTWDDTVRVEVLLDAPTADAGEDVAVLAGQPIQLLGTAKDGRGKVVLTEWKIGSGEFLRRSRSDTSLAPLSTPQTLMAWLRVTDDDGNQAVDSVKITVRASTNNLLQALSVASVTLSPAVFNSGVFTYSANVAYTVSSVSLTATTMDPAATLTVNGAAATSGTARTLNLTTGSNVIRVAVKAQDGSEETYTVTLTRALDSDNALVSLGVSSGTLSPAFSAATLNYIANVAANVSSVEVTATARTTATLTINDAPATSGVAATVNLVTGANIIPIVVKAQDGSTRTYKLAVNRAQDTNFYLQGLSVASVTLSPAFNASTVNYTGAVPNATGSVSLTATTQSAVATLTVNGLAATSGTAVTVTLVVGANAIPVVVTAQDGSKHTYTVTLTRAQDANNNLSALTASAGTLSPAFAQGTTTYDLVVPDATTSVRLTPTAAATTSTLTVNGTAVVSGSQSAALALTAGQMTTATVVVTAQSGATKTYTVRMHRGGWVQAGGNSSPSAGFGYALASDGTNVWQVAREGAVAVVRRLVGSVWNLMVTLSGVSNPNVMNIASDGSEVYVSNSNTTNGMQISAYDGGNWGGADFGSVGTSKMAMGNGRVYMVYTSNSPVAGSLYVLTLNGTSWSLVGESVLGAESGVTGVDIAVGSDGNPWIAYNGVASGTPVIRVRRWTGTTWTYTGGSADALAGVGFSNFALALLNNQPYLAYGDAGAASRLTVKQVGATTQLGARGFSPTGLLVNMTHLDGSSGSLIAAASLQNAGGTSYSGYAWRWTGTQWEMLGGGATASGATAGLSFTVHNGTPYLGQINGSASQVFRYVTTAP